MSAVIPTKIFEKGSVEKHLANVNIFLGIVTFSAIIIGLFLATSATTDNHATTAFGVAALTGVANLYALAVFAVILYDKTRTK